MKQEKRVTVERMSLYDFEGTFEEVISHLQRRENYYKKYLKDPPQGTLVFNSFTLDVIGKEYEDGNEIGIIGTRFETDEEENARAQETDKWKTYRLKQYNDLKKEFGDA